MKTILVADDIFSDVRGLILTLKARYEVEYVSDGKQAIERIEKGSLDGVVLDWDMLPPNIDRNQAQQFYGNEVAKRAREIAPTLAIVLRSSVAESYRRELKPFEVYLHDKFQGNQAVIDYFAQKLG